MPDAWQEYQTRRAEIESLLDPRCYTIDWLDSRIWNGGYSLLANDRAVIVTEIRTYPAGARELHGIVAAGELSGIIELIERAEAEAEDCDFAVISSREGWAKVMRPYGYEVHQVEIRKELR